MAQARGQRGEGDARITNHPPAGLTPKEGQAGSAAEGALAIRARKSGPQMKRLGTPRR